MLINAWLMIGNDLCFNELPPPLPHTFPLNKNIYENDFCSDSIHDYFYTIKLSRFIQQSSFQRTESSFSCQKCPNLSCKSEPKLKQILLFYSTDNVISPYFRLEFTVFMYSLYLCIFTNCSAHS